MTVMFVSKQLSRQILSNMTVFLLIIVGFFVFSPSSDPSLFSFLSFRSNIFSEHLWIISSTRLIFFIFFFFLLVPNDFFFFKFLCCDLVLILNLCYPWRVWPSYTVSWALIQTAKLLCDRNQVFDLCVNRKG